MKTKHEIELDTDGKYCGKCRKRKDQYTLGMLTGGYCSEFEENVNFENYKSFNSMRCQACLDSEVKEPEVEKRTGLHTGLTAVEFENHPNFDSWNDSHMVSLVQMRRRDAQKKSEPNTSETKL